MRSRVMPGSSPTMERREPVRRLKSVDLPTLGRPTMAMSGRLELSVACCSLFVARRSESVGICAARDSARDHAAASAGSSTSGS